MFRRVFHAFEFFENYHASKISSKEILDLEMRIRDVATEASCAIDCHSMDVTLIKHGYSGDNTSQLFPDDALHRIMKDIESIKEEAMKIMKDVKASEDQLSPGVAPSVPSRRAPGHVENNTTMVGFDRHMVAVMERIKGHQSTLQILPIVGMGGIGKTTLAQNVFDHKFVKEHFQIRLWSTISQSNKVHDILSSFLLDLNNVDDTLSSSMHSLNNTNPLGNNILGDKLYKVLFGRRYLIVMDDIWSVELWDTIRRFFPENNNGSSIIVTTRLLHVASYIGSCDPYKLGNLGQDESWKLLERKVFAQHGCPSTLADVGRRIAASCEGLPLAIVVIAGHLSKSDMTQKSWENVAGALISILHSENDGQCPATLSLSYDNLPIHLKPCFLFMAFLPEDCKFRASYVIKSWVAHGLLKPIGHKCLEDVAMEYLTDLVERNLISVSMRKSSGKIKRFRIHDLLLDLGKRRCCENNFLYSRVLAITPTPGIGTKSNIHKCVNDKDVPTVEKFFRRDHCFNLACSNWANEWDARGSLLQFRLRYIRILASGATNIPTFSAILASISKLQNLQTIIMNRTLGNEPVVLPPQIWEMPLLRHLHIKQVVIPDPPTTEAHVTEKEHCVLDNMQTLSDVRNFKVSEEVLKRIPNLKRLGMTYTEVSGSADEWQDYCLHNLSQFSRLESLSLSVCRSIAALDFSLPQSLKKLTLDGCKLPWEDVTMVGSLPNLEVLQLRNDAFCARVWRPVEGEFCRLKSLHLLNMSLQQWEADSSHFPRLERLILCNMERLKEIPPGIGDITTLQFISVENSRYSLLSSARRLIEEQESMGNNGIQVERTRQLSTCHAHKEIFDLLYLNSHPPNDTSVMAEKLLDDVRELYDFLKYTDRKEMNNQRLKELVKHVQDVLCEHLDVSLTLDIKRARGGTIDNYTLRRFVFAAKAVDYASIRVQRILLVYGEIEEFELYACVKITENDWSKDYAAFNDRVQRTIVKNLMDYDRDWIKKLEDFAKYLEPDGSCSRVKLKVRDFAPVTHLDGILPENEENSTVVHTGVCCDHCGMDPIVGVRYRCKDCMVDGGFDFCEECYSVRHSLNLLGNSRTLEHTLEHEFEVLTSRRVRSGCFCYMAQYGSLFTGAKLAPL